MLSLSASQPTVSATTRTRLALHVTRDLHYRLVDALDEIVATLIQLVDVSLRGGDLMVVLDTRLVLLVPQLDVRLGESRDQHADCVVHPLTSHVLDDPLC